MSGAEIGLALGVVPLLISTIEHYHDCLRPFKRYKNFKTAESRFRERLEVQKIIFRYNCLILLEEILGHDAASSILDDRSGLNHTSWSENELEERLSQLLGKSGRTCINRIAMIKDRLRDIDHESQKLLTTVDQGSQNTSKPTGSIAKKLRFSCSQGRLDQFLRDLSALQSRRQVNVPKKPDQEVKKYQIIGEASRQVYEALGRACTKHTEHQAHFCVEVEQAKITGDHGAQIKFSMAYTNMAWADSADRGDLLWFAVDTTSGDAVEPGNTNTTTVDHDSLGQHLRNKDQSASAATQKKPQKRVRFQSASPALVYTSSTLSTTRPANPMLSSDGMCKDFCDVMRRRLREPLQAGECVVVLEDTNRCKSLVYPSPNKSCHQIRQAVSLGQVLSKVSKRQEVDKLALYDRLRLARTLAIGVLQYHSTPWLRISWRSEDIYFFGNDVASPQDLPSIISPHLNVKVKRPYGELSRASTFPLHSPAGNPLLFRLAVVLLEIAYTSTMRTLQRDSDLDDGPDNEYTEFMTARRLAASAKTDMGVAYHKIAERLVYCDFGCGRDLSDPQLQAAFHDNVICALERLEKKYSEFYFDIP